MGLVEELKFFRYKMIRSEDAILSDKLELILDDDD
jgi:hypothetical protein